MYIFEDGIVEAVLDAGSRCLVTPAVIEVPGWAHFSSWRARLDDMARFHDEHSGRDARIEIGFAGHSAYALPLEALDATAAAARERGALVHVHVAETQDEAAELEREHGKSVPALLAERGFLDGRTLAAHSVWLSDDDLRLYREHDVAVAHCPQSNAKLAAGVARVADMLALGIRVGLGTDGPASNNNLDLWEELRLAPLLARLRNGDAQALPAREALALATRGGAEALGLGEVGVVAPGRAADMVLVSLDAAAFAPRVEERDLVSHLVWAASSRLVTDVWVAGRQVVAAGRCTTVDEERARREVEARAARLARST